MLLLLGQLSYAQDKGNVSIHADARLALLMNRSHTVEKAVAAKSAAMTKPPKIKPQRNTQELIKDSKEKEAPSKAVLSAPVASIAKTADIKPAAVKAPAKPELAKADAPKDNKTPHRAVMGQSHGPRYTGPGFRVQIYNGPDRMAALKIKSEFMSRNPGVHTYIFYSSPHYKVKAGDFRNRNDALELFHAANETYSPCMIVPDQVLVNAN